jgi:hypothetical protein
MAKRSNNQVEMRYGRESVVELMAVYAHHMHDYTADDRHEVLLGAHLGDMYYKLETMLHKMDASAKLGLNMSECVAFMDYWGNTDTSAFPLATVLILGIINKIDKRRIKGGLIE